MLCCCFLFNVPVNNVSVIWDGATASWVFTSTLETLKLLAQGHYTVVVGFEPWTSRSTTEPPRPRMSKLNICKNVFGNRVVHTWNSLSDSVVWAPSINSFKNRLNRHWLDHPGKFEPSCYILHATRQNARYSHLTCKRTSRTWNSVQRASRTWNSLIAMASSIYKKTKRTEYNLMYDFISFL